MFYKKLLLPPKFKFLFKTKHPWIFSNQLRPFSKNLKNGDWLEISIDKEKEKIFGVYSSDGLVAVRIFHFGNKFTLNDLKLKIQKAFNLRIHLFKETNSLRFIHGENDFIPGITVDFHNQILCLSYYSDSLILLVRYISHTLYDLLKKSHFLVKTILLYPPNRIGKNSMKANLRLLRGEFLETTSIKQNEYSYLIDTNSQKTGIYNDIRNLRRYLITNDIHYKDKSVLNLFSSNGFLSEIIALKSKSILSIEDSSKMINIHLKNRDILKNNNSEIIKLDIFKNLEFFLKEKSKSFDLIIIDPPSLTNSKKDIFKAKKIYKRLITSSLEYLKNKGTFILCSCSNRIHPNEFEKLTKEIIQKEGYGFEKFVKLKNEMDHPVVKEFPEGDYFKVHIFIHVYKMDLPTNKVKLDKT